MHSFKIDYPENHGLTSRSLSRFFDRIEQEQLAVNSFILLQDGHVTAQMWRAPYRPDCPQLLYSLSKSITSIAAGIAMDNGFIRLNDRVIDFFPERCPERISDNLAKMTIHHLLSMNTGHAPNIYSAVTGETDWVRAFLSLDVECEPGSHYAYNTPASYMISAIIRQATGLNMVDFLMPRLFKPLGIAYPVWETCPMGITAGGMGLNLRTEDVAKIGQMLLDNGRFAGKTIVSEEYLAMALREQSDNRQGASEIDTAQGYGYQFFLGRRGCFRGVGAFGQLLFVAPAQRVVIAATTTLYKGQSQTLLDLIYEHIIDELDGRHHVHPVTAESVALRQRLAHMAYPAPAASAIPENVPKLDDRWYVLENNPETIQKMGFARSGDRLQLRLHYEGREQRVLGFDFRAPVTNHDTYVKDLAIHQQEAVTYAHWHDSTTLQLTIRYIETPYCVDYNISFKDDGIELQFQQNVSMTFSDYRVMGRPSD